MQLRKILDILSGRRILEFLAAQCQRLTNILKCLEGHELRAVSIFNTVLDLLSWLRNPGFTTAACEAAMTNAAAKLQEYVEGDKQPARLLLMAVRVFDPQQLPLLPKAIADFGAMPNILKATDKIADIS